MDQKDSILIYIIGVAFSDAQVHPFGDSPFSEAGRTQLLNACRALRSADEILRELTAREIGYKALSVSLEELALPKDTVRPLQMLRLWIVFPPKDESAGDTRRQLVDARSIMVFALVCIQ